MAPLEITALVRYCTFYQQLPVHNVKFTYANGLTQEGARRRETQGRRWLTCRRGKTNKGDTPANKSLQVRVTRSDLVGITTAAQCQRGAFHKMTGPGQCTTMKARVKLQAHILQFCC